MAISHARSGQLVRLPLGAGLDSSRTTTLLKTSRLELIRLVLPKGKAIPIHRAPGEITVQCLEGRIAFTAGTETQELTAGDLLFLAAREPHALTALAPSSVLVTLALPDKKPAARLDVVQEASEESFPASDSPAWFVRS